MKTNTLRQEFESIDPPPEQQQTWDAQAVWRERVRQGPPQRPAPGPAQGWDPYLVWLSRVKKG
ncbi:MAG: hypothetical protein HC872_02630 [Gammaproteobacteria bacterium]|nr:hypothetical protein [Gammaproteobacteria bacterium]